MNLLIYFTLPPHLPKEKLYDKLILQLILQLISFAGVVKFEKDVTSSDKPISLSLNSSDKVCSGSLVVYVLNRFWAVMAMKTFLCYL